MIFRTVVAAVIAALTGLAGPALAQGDAMTVRLLSLNVHGLPGLIAKDAPQSRIPIIARKTGDFDIALLQEDFSHQALVDANTRHTVIVRGDRQSAGWIGALTGLAASAVKPFGSGLTVLTSPATGRVVAEQRQAFGICEGYLGAAQDCFAEKGVLMVRLRLANAAEVDVYETHLEAGGGRKDQDIRVKQLSMIADFMKRHSAGRAVVFAGDFNLDWRNKTHQQAMKTFLTATGLTRLGTGQGGRQIDYILVRSGDNATVTPRTAEVADDFQHGGKPLSDHPALTATLAVMPR